MIDTFSVRKLTKAAVIAVVYAVLTILPGILGLSSGMFQLRISEMLCVLPVFTTAAVPGLAIGCFLANIICGGTALDIILGTAATLIGALGTALMKKYGKYAALLPPVFVNALIVPFILIYGMGLCTSYFLIAGLILLSEIVSCFVLGSLLGAIIENNKQIKKALCDE